MTEEWRPVVGYEGLYEVSDQGRVRSLDRLVMRHGGLASGRPMRQRGRVLKPRPMPTGHLQVNLANGGVSTNRLVHRLVLLAFVGPQPEGREGCHNDGDPANNWVGNLRWDTRSANNYDKVRHGRCPKASRTHCPRGHALAAPNLVACSAAKGFRSCLACSRAQSSARKVRLKGRPVDVDAIADARYADIMAVA